MDLPSPREALMKVAIERACQASDALVAEAITAYLGRATWTMAEVSPRMSHNIHTNTYAIDDKPLIRIVAKPEHRPGYIGINVSAIHLHRH